MESNPIKVFKSNLLLLLFLEFVHWIAHVCQRKPQKNFNLSPLTSLRNRASICSPYLSTCLIREKIPQKCNSQWPLWWMSPCRLLCCPPGYQPRQLRGLLWGETPVACAGPACSSRGRKEGLHPPLHRGLLWQPQVSWQVPLRLSKGDKSAHLSPSTTVYPAASS